MASPGPLQLHMLRVHLLKFPFSIGTWFNRILSKTEINSDSCGGCVWLCFLSGDEHVDTLMTASHPP